MTSSRLRKGNCQMAFVERAERLAAQVLETLVHRLERVAQAAFAEELRLAEIRIPAGAADPAAHHVAPARHAIDVVSGARGQQFENFVAHLFGAALVGVQTENPIVLAGFERAVAQFAEASERHLHHARAERGGDLGGAVGAVGIDHHHLVGPQHACDRRGDFLGLVIAQDIGGYLCHGPVVGRSRRAVPLHNIAGRARPRGLS